MPDVLVRLLISLVLILLGYLTYRWTRHSTLKKTRSLTQPFIRPGRRRITILYFTTPDCVACRSAQKPALQQLKDTLGNRLDVVEINAYEKPELAHEWGVMGVPTTFILNEEGTAKEVNFGVAPFHKLMEQIGK